MCGEANYKAMLSALWLEAVLWGAYVLIYCITIQALSQGRREKIFYLISTCNFLLSTASLVGDFSKQLVSPAIVCRKDCHDLECLPCGVETLAVVQQTNRANLLEAIGVAFFIANQTFADGLMIWRCFVVWGRNRWIIILPTLCLLGATANGLYGLYIQIMLYLIRANAPITESSPPTSWLRFSAVDISVSLASYVLPLVTNFILTCLIVARILYMTSDINKVAKHSRTKSKGYDLVISVLVESGAMIVVAYALNTCGVYVSNTLNVISDGIINQVIGLAPALLIIRLASATEAKFEISHVIDAVTEKYTAIPLELVNLKEDRVVAS